MNKIFLPIKILYMILPKFIRNQYDDSVLFYRDISLKVINKLNLVLSKSNTKQINENLSLTLVKKIEDLECSYKILYTQKNRENHINSPKIRIDDQNYFKAKLHNCLPEINVYSINGISVVGLTDALIYNEKFLHEELNLMENFHDLKRPDIFLKLNADTYNIAVNYQPRVKIQKTYISLLKEHSTNYFHWTTEALPRLILIVETLEKNNSEVNYDDYILLVDEDMPHQCIDSIEIILKSKIDIIYIKRGEKFFCEKLIYCAPLWNSLDNTTGLPNPKKEFFIDKYALQIVRDKILANYDKSSAPYFESKKIYLQRLNNKLRPITNINKVELLLYKYGFEFIDVGSLSLSEQINLFQYAEIVIGVSGAAFTNLLYMKDHAKAINFYPSTSSINYYIFQPLADVASIDLTHFLTIPRDGETSIHAEASINLSSLENYLEEL